MHGIGWTPDQEELWQRGQVGDPQLYIWNIQNPMEPIFQTALPLRNGHGSHWLTFSIKGDYAYVAPDKFSNDESRDFAVESHSSAA